MLWIWLYIYYSLYIALHAIRGHCLNSWNIIDGEQRRWWYGPNWWHYQLAVQTRGRNSSRTGCTLKLGGVSKESSSQIRLGVAEKLLFPQVQRWFKRAQSYHCWCERRWFQMALSDVEMFTLFRFFRGNVHIVSRCVHICLKFVNSYLNILVEVY